MQAADGLRQTGYVIVMILLMMALFFLLIGDGWTAGVLALASSGLMGLIEWVRSHMFRGFGRNDPGLPRG